MTRPFTIWPISSAPRASCCASIAAKSSSDSLMPLPLRGLPGGLPPEAIIWEVGGERSARRRSAWDCSLLAREPVLLDERPELLRHLSGPDRLVAHDRLQRLCPAAELDRVTAEELLTGHSSPPPRICAHERGPTVSSEVGAAQTIRAGLIPRRRPRGGSTPGSPAIRAGIRLPRSGGSGRGTGRSDHRGTGRRLARPGCRMRHT